VAADVDDRQRRVACAVVKDIDDFAAVAELVTSTPIGAPHIEPGRLRSGGPYTPSTMRRSRLGARFLRPQYSWRGTATHRERAVTRKLIA